MPSRPTARQLNASQPSRSPRASIQARRSPLCTPLRTSDWQFLYTLALRRKASFILGPPLPRATTAILDLLRAEGTASMQALLASRGIQHATALKHLMHLLDRGLIQEEALLKLHELHLGT